MEIVSDGKDAEACAEEHIIKRSTFGQFEPEQPQAQ